MAWLQKRPQVSNPTMFYTVGMNKSLLIVGLGNPGQEYDNTRHNIGFACVDAFVHEHDELSDWVAKKDLQCLFSSGQLGGNRVIVIKSTTFMNLSGEAVQAVANFYKIPTQAMVVVHDELDIDFGAIRTRVGGNSAGHNGIKSVIEHCGADFGRIRVGIGPKTPEQIDSSDFVLAKFGADQLSHLPALTKEVNAILSEYVFGGELPHETRSFIV